MTHSEATNAFPAYFNGTLGREEVRGLHAHLKDCDACRARVRLQKAIGQSSLQKPSNSLVSPETQSAMARNRDLLVKLLILMVLAWAVFRFKH